MIAQLKIKLLSWLLRGNECLLFAKFPIGTVEGKTAFTFTSALQLNEEKEYLTQFIRQALISKVEIRDFLLNVCIEYLKDYEIDKKNFVKKLYNAE